MGQIGEMVGDDVAVDHDDSIRVVMLKRHPMNHLYHWATGVIDLLLQSRVQLGKKVDDGFNAAVILAGRQHHC